MYNFRPHAAVTAASVDAADAPIDLPSGEMEVQHAHTSNTNMNNPPSQEEHGTSWAQEDQQQYMHQQQQQHDDPTQVAPQVGASDDTDAAAAATTTDEVQPPVGASDEEVLLFYRHMMENHAMAPPKAWRQIRFDLPSTVAELRLYPPERVRAQPHGRSLQPSSCVVVELDGVVPDGTSVQAYMGQLVSYLLDLMRYNSASTAITSLRFIKRGSALSQVVLTFGKDVRLATRMVESMVEAGMQASFGPPVTYFPPNATFSVVEYEAKMRNGAGITPEDLLLLLTPIKRVSQQHGGGVSSSGTNTSTSLHVVPQTPDILIVPGYEPGVFFVPVKRPESIFAILWNPFASFTYQAAMFARFGVLITMTACPHEYLHKGIPYAQQKQRLEEERARRPGSMVSAATSSNAAPSAAFMMASLVGTSNMDALLGGAEEGGAMSATGAHHAHAQHGVNGESDDDEEEEQAGSEGDENAEASWANNAEDVVDIYAALLGGGATTTEDANIATRMMQDELHFTTPTTSVVHHENNQARPMQYAHHLPQQQQPPVYGSAPNAYPELVDDDDDEDAVGTSPWTSSRQHPYEARGAQPSWKQGGGGDGILPMESGSSGAVLPQPASPPSYFTSTQTRTQPSSSSQSSSHAARGGGSVYGHQPTPTPRRPPISVDDARQLAMMVEDCVRDLLPTTYAIYAADIDASATTTTTTTTTTTCATSEDAIMHHIAPDVRVPPMSVEMMQLMELLTKESHKILALLRCPAAEMGWEGLAEAKQQLSHALLVSIPPPRNVDDSSDFVRQCWCARVEDDEEDDDDDGVRDEDAKKDEDDASKAVDAATPVLPSMFPYLLSTPCGVDVIAVLLQQHHARIAPLLAVYLPPFLLDAHVVQEVGCALLQVDASSSNVVVRRILRHWLPLMLWLQQLIAARASSEAASSSSSPTHVEDDDVRRNAASKRLLSQLGNTFDVFLAALSPSQRAACRAFSDEKNMLANFVELMKTSSSVDGAASGGDVAQPNTSETTTTTKSATEVMVGDPLWGVRGAVLRTLLRLYVNADVVSGDALAHELVGEDNVVHQEHLFFAISAATRSAVSPSLSVESAVFCGNILRSIEEANNRNDAPTTTTSSSSSSMKMKSLGEREALQLLDAIFRSTSTDASYAALRRAYFAEPAPSPRILKIVARLSNAQRMHMTEQQQQQHSILGAPAFSHNNNNNNNVHVGAAAQWKQAWSVAMRTYPMVGEPFTPLPASWTSSISRSYGHYYYRDASGSASYVHPADAAEYMVSPQAFVLEPKGGVKLEEIVAEANRIQRRDRASSSSSSSKTEDAPREISREDAEMWLRDQRQRHLFLDLAVLRVLRITYTSSSSSSALQARGRGAGGGETQRANNTATSSSSMKTTKSMTKDELHELLRTWMHHYPTRGVPFPPLPRGWSVNMSSATGIYVFRPPSGGDGRTSSSPPTSLHPKTRGCYPVSPQAFAEQRGVSCEAIARVSCTSVEEVVRWMKDQRRRDAAMDYAVANIVPVQYAVDVMAADAAEMCRRRDGNTPPESRRRRRSRSRDSHSGSDDDDEDDDDDDDDGVSLTDSEVLRRGQRRGQTRGVRSRRGGGGRGNRGGGGGGGGARRRR